MSTTTTAPFDRAQAIKVIIDFVGTQPASIANFRTWLNELETDQLQHFYASILDGMEAPASRCVLKSPLHKTHATDATGRPLCGGGHQARSVPAWQQDIGETNCQKCSAILARRRA